MEIGRAIPTGSSLPCHINNHGPELPAFTIAMALYDTGITYDSGAHYDEATALPRTKMAKPKLDLDNKSEPQIIALANTHKTQITGNANFPTPLPAPATYDAAITAASDKLGAIAVAETDLAQMRSEKDALMNTLRTLLTQRASYVETTANGDGAKIQSAGFDLQSSGTPTSSLPQPGNLVASIGDNEGEIDVACNAVKRAKSYIWECREHVEGQPPGPWMQCAISARSSTRATGLVSGKRYAFRVRALGPNETQSPWSDEAVSMAA